MTAVLPPRVSRVRVAEPGVYQLSEEDYHGDPVPEGSLSTSGAKLLLPPSCPAKFRWEQDHPADPKAAFDLGHAVHKLILGVGSVLVEVKANDWKTKAAREARDEAYADGKVPLLTSDLLRARAMAESILRHKLASRLLNPAHGSPEQSLFWRDEETGVMRRARLDWLPNGKGRQFIIVDPKTCISAAPDTLGKTIHNFNYHMQGAAYIDAVKALGLCDNPAFVFVLAEKTPPFLVTVAQLDGTAERIGRELNRRALRVYAECVEADEWPGYTKDVELVSLPPWAERQHELTD